MERTPGRLTRPVTHRRPRKTDNLGISKKMAMASVLVRNILEIERRQAQQAAPLLHKTNLANYLRRQIRQLIQDAKEKYPEKFAPEPCFESPVDEFLYFRLTKHGRRTVDDLVAETPFNRRTIKEALDRLRKAELVDALPQGQATEGQPGAQRLIWISLAEVE